MTKPQFSIFSHSLGSAQVHSLPAKLNAASEAGYSCVEIFQADLDHHLDSSGGRLRDEVSAAHEIGTLCRSLGLKVLCLQPLRDLPGLLDDAPARRQTLCYAKSRFEIMDALGTDLIVCCSSRRKVEELRRFSVESYANELGHFADLARECGRKRVAFEALSWGTTISTWSIAWKVVELANRSNLGMCLDTFNSLAREWADPTSWTGTLDSPKQRLSTLLQQLSKLPKEKVFLFQIADARRLPQPLPSKGINSQPPIMTWSRSSRLFPCELHRGAYLPILEFVSCVVDQIGYTGPWSLEVFNDSLSEVGDDVPESHARRGIIGLETLHQQLLRRHSHKRLASSSSSTRQH